MTSDTARPVQRRWRILSYWPLAALVFAGLVVAIGLWLWHSLYTIAVASGRIPLPAQQSAQDRARLKAAVDAIRESGEPLTTQEINEFRRIPAGVPDLTADWIALLNSLDPDRISVEIAELPMIGAENRRPPPPGEPWSDREAVEAILQKYDSQLAECQRLSKVPGEVRFAVSYLPGVTVDIPHADALRGLNKLLRLKFHVFLHAGDHEAAYNCLLTRFSLAKTLAHDHLVLCWLIQLAIEKSVLEDVALYASAAPFDEVRYRELQALVAGRNVEQDLTAVFIGERARFWQIMHHELYVAEEGLDAKLLIEAGDDLGRIARMRDCAVGLERYGAAIAMSRRGYPAALENLGQWERDFDELLASTKRKSLEYYGALMFGPTVAPALKAAAASGARRNVFIGQLASARYSVVHGAPPNSLDDLVPQFVASPLLDPFDGKPLRSIVCAHEFVVYSIGRDLSDDGGVESDDSGEPDIVCVFPLRVGPNPEPAPRAP